MENTRNIVIGDESALFALMHSDWGSRISRFSLPTNPLSFSAEKLGELSAFNVDNPLYGQKPIKLLIPHGARRRLSATIQCRYAPANPPEHSFFMLREGLYLTSPELTFLRMAPFRSEIQLAQIATNLCGRYYIDPNTKKILNRTSLLTTPDDLRTYCSAFPNARGSQKAIRALRWSYPNSGSPKETQIQLLLTLPLGQGGFGLAFPHMNFDVKAGRLAQIAEQSTYCIDCANPTKKVGVEYDGQESHRDSSHDKRRRNELKALGWDIFPLEHDVLDDPDRLARFAQIVAMNMDVRPRHSRAWASKYLKIRKELGLYR